MSFWNQASVMVDTEESSAERQRRVVMLTTSGRTPPRLQQNTLTAAAVKDLFKEYKSYCYETELLSDTSMENLVGSSRKDNVL